MFLQAQSLYFPPTNDTGWAKLSPGGLGWDTTRIDSLYHFLSQNRTKAFLLLKDGKIVIEWYFGSFTKDSLWYWASAGKGLTAFLVGIAQQEGYLRITDPSTQWLGPGWTSAPPDKEALITIRHQLTMTSGLEDSVPDPYCTLPACLSYKADAGTRWAYHNAPYTLLDSVIKAATGRSINAYFYQKVASKTGMRGAFLRIGYNSIFFSEARSMARFGLLILSKGWWDQTPILTDTTYYNQMLRPSQALNPAYGYLWWLNGQPYFMVPGLQMVFPGSLFPSAPADMVSALGKDDQILDVVPGEKLVVVRMGEASYLASGPVPFTFHEQLWQHLRAIMVPAASLAGGDQAFSIPMRGYSVSPNPFWGETVVTFELGKPLPVRVKVLDMLGREIATVAEGFYERGRHDLVLQGDRIASGVYLCRLTAGEWYMERLLLKIDGP